MKHLFVFSVLLISILACVWPPVELSPTPATSLEPAKNPAQISISTPIPMFGTVDAEKGLRLRSVPDSAGPEESWTLTIMPDGSAFLIEKCQEFHGQPWAYGEYKDTRGVSWTGWAAVRYLKGGCRE